MNHVALAFLLPLLSLRTCPEARPAVDEAHAAVALSDDTLAQCRAQYSPAMCEIDFIHACAAPVRPIAASLLERAPEGYGRAYFDGTRCYVATEAEPGPCMSTARCHAWTTLAACEQARLVCAERP